MVSAESRFLIDTVFIFERTYKTFFETPLLTAERSDHTFTFGFARDFLRLRRNLGIRTGVLIIGKEVHSITTDKNIENVIHILKELRMPYIHDSQNLGLHLVGSLCHGFSHIVTGDRRFLQLSGTNVRVVLVQKGTRNQYDLMSSETVTSECRIREHYENSKADRVLEPISCNAENCSLGEIDTESNRNLLRTYGFHSLVAMLADPSDVRLELNDIKTTQDSYHAVVDSKGMRELECLMRSAKQCSIDTESDDKDPRQGTLLGVSFSVKAGEAYFVPLIDNDLKDLGKDDVVDTLKRICGSDIHVIGHNAKYDYLLLRRHGIRIKSIQFDTMLAAYVCHGDWASFSLQYIARRLLGQEIKAYSDVVDKDSTFRDLPFKEMFHHACQDADITMRLYPILRDQLKEKHITEEFSNHTMPLVQCLGDLEFQGVSVDSGQIDVIRRSLTEKASRLKDNICKKVGKVFDLESEKDLSEVLREALVLRGHITPRRITMSILEQLATSEPMVRSIVEYKRLRKRIMGVDSISAAGSDGKICPLFNQIRSRAGLMATTRPSLFDIDSLPGLRSCFDISIYDYFKDRQRSLDTLAKMTQDPILQSVQTSKSQVDIFMAKHPFMKDCDRDELLLSLVLGKSESKLSKQFLVDRFTVRTIKRDLETRYQALFHWQNNYRRMAQAKGYGINPIDGKRKYIDGLKSSDIAKQEQALEDAVRWLIRY
jgi:DNA polymerase I-like protein with 3'-5' exonuclease and polymerase domains